MTETPETSRTHDTAVTELSKSLINVFIKSSQDTHGDTPLDKLKNAAKYDGNEPMWSAVSALSAHRSARAAERQAAAMETIAKSVEEQHRSITINTDAQAIIDQREPRRDYLASTYSLPTGQLTLLWAMRGIVMDAAVKALSRPASFEPYERVSTEEMAWALRTTTTELYHALPKRNESGDIDFQLLEEFGVYHYSGSPETPDSWMFGG